MRYPNANTRRHYERDLKALFVFAGVDHPGLLTESVVLAWWGRGSANNTVRNTLSRAFTLIRLGWRDCGPRRSSIYELAISVCMALSPGSSGSGTSAGPG